MNNILPHIGIRKLGLALLLYGFAIAPLSGLAAEGVNIKFRLGDTQGDNVQGWELRIDGTSIVSVAAGSMTNVWHWMNAGSTHIATLHCTTITNILRYDYELYIDDMDSARRTPHYLIEDPYVIMGNHYVKDQNTFDPTGRPVTFSIFSTNSSPESISPQSEEALTTDPINLMTGNLEFKETDVVIPAPRMPLEFRRRYNSRQTGNSLLGRRWSHTYNWSVTNLFFASGASSATATTSTWAMVKSEQGLEYWFQRLTNGNYAASFDNNWQLSGSSTSGYQLALSAGNILTFNSNGLLQTITNAWGNALALTYSTVNGTNILTNVQHSDGQSLTFSYSGGEIAGIATPSTNLSVTFGYHTLNAIRRLVSATQVTPSGNFTTTYSYNADTNVSWNNLVTQRVNKLGDVFSYAYPSTWLPTCTNLVLSTNLYQHSVLYASSNRTVLTYTRTSGPNQLYEYSFDRGPLRLLSIMGPHTATGQVTRGVTYGHDSSGNITNKASFDSSVGETNTVAMLYDTFHNMTNWAYGYRSPATNGWAFAWNTNLHVVTTITDPEGRKTGFEYTNGVVSRMRLYRDATNSFDTLFGYTTAGLLASITNANGNRINFSYDAYGRVNRIEPQVGPIAQFSNNVLGQLVSITLPGETGTRTTTLDPDSLGRVRSISYPLGLSETFGYDAFGNLTNYVDTAGRTTRYSWLPSSKLSSVTRTLSTGAVLTNRVVYDNQFNSLTFTDAKGRSVESYQLDIVNRPVAITNLESQGMSVIYGVDNFVRQVTRFDGTKVTNAYDNSGRLSVIVYPDVTNRFSYFRNDLLHTSSNPMGRVTLSYDGANRLTNAIGVGSKGRLTYAYYPAGNVSNAVSAVGTNLYRYDAAERVERIQSPFASFLYAYNTNNGLTASMTVSNVGIRAVYSFDALDRITGINWLDASSGTLRSFTYGYDSAHMITNVAREDGSSTAYSYDTIDRLTGETRRFAGFTNQLRYTYDDVGNRTHKTNDSLSVTYTVPYGTSGNRMSGWSATVGGTAVGTMAAAGYASEAIGTNIYLGQLFVSNALAVVTPSVATTNFSAAAVPVSVGTNVFMAAIGDVAGNVGFAYSTVTVSVATSGAYQYNTAGCLTNIQYVGSIFTQSLALTWNSLYQMTVARTNGVVAETYQYDSFGRRVTISNGSTTNWLVYDGLHVVAEADKNGIIQQSFTYGPGIDNWLSMSVHTGATPVTYFYLTDNRGTVHALASTNGVIVESYSYDAWGRVLGVYDGNGTPLTESAVGNRILFQGREYSWKTGLYYFRARWYDPVSGRWLSNDPIGISGGLNQYVFCANNPVNFVDPTGEAWSALEGYDYWSDVAVSGQDAGGALGNLQTAGASVMMSFIEFWGARDVEGSAGESGYYSGSDECQGKAWKSGLYAAGMIGINALPGPKGLKGPGKYFGGKTADEVIEALTRKYGAPRSVRPGAQTFYNPRTGRSFNVHTDPAHGAPHVDIRRRGGYPERSYPLGGP